MAVINTFVVWGNICIIHNTHCFAMPIIHYSLERNHLPIKTNLALQSSRGSTDWHAGAGAFRVEENDLIVVFIYAISGKAINASGIP